MSTDLGVEERRVAIEAISTLVHIKRTLIDLLLKPAGVPPMLAERLFGRRDPTTNKLLTKRQVAPLLLDELDKSPEYRSSIRAILKITSEWNAFHLAENEYAARATVQKARELMGTVRLMEAREAEQRELARREELARLANEKQTLFQKHSAILLMMFNEMVKDNSDPHQRGFLLQELLTRLFDLHEIPVHRSFQRNNGAEQIDGAFKLDGWHYIVECRWRQKLSDIRELDGLLGQVNRSGKQTLGLFTSINGWSSNVVPLLKQNPDKSIFLMDGYDLRSVLERPLSLKDFLNAKLSKLNLDTEPFYGALQYLQDQ
ncbi:MAG: hypothetical protein AB1500_08545 [Bacillota bacterium]